MNELDEVVEAMLPKYLAEHGHETRFVHEFVTREVVDSEGIRERIRDLLVLALKDDPDTLEIKSCETQDI